LNKAGDVERWIAVGNLLGRLSLIANELEHISISVLHTPTVLLVADGIGRRAHADADSHGLDSCTSSSLENQARLAPPAR
jgi:hypothetical protein